MAGVYSVEGKLGTGKTKFAVWMAAQALAEGRRVAGNVDLYCDKLWPRAPRSYTRIPDKPSAFDLDALGKGSDGPYDEDEFGVLLLDELGTWLNSRSFQDKERAKVLDWLIHARKHRWEVYLIVQDAGMIDKQVRESLVEYQCRCLRGDKVLIPFVGKIIRDLAMAAFGPQRRVLGRKAKRWGYLPKFHLVTARLGFGADSAKVVAERWMYMGTHLHAGYNTEQAFSADYPHGSHSVLPPWDFKPPLGLWERLKRAVLPAPCPRPVRAAKPRPMALLAGLPADEAWRLAQRYVGHLPLKTERSQAETRPRAVGLPAAVQAVGSSDIAGAVPCRG